MSRGQINCVAREPVLNSLGSVSTQVTHLEHYDQQDVQLSHSSNAVNQTSALAINEAVSSLTDATYLRRLIFKDVEFFLNYLEELFSMSNSFALSRGHLTMSGDIFVFHDCRVGCAIDIEWVETRDATKHLKIIGYDKELSSPTC